MTDRNEARTALDLFLFEDIINNWIRGPLEDQYEITYIGDEYLVLHRNTGQMYQFTVAIEDGGEEDFTDEIKAQEWFEGEEDETGGYIPGNH